MAKIKGITLELGGEDFVVPPLPLGALEVLQERIELFTGGLDKGSVATVIDCLHASLKRNYPEKTREDVAELVDVGNMGDVMQAVMDVSGMRRKQIEAAAAGNLLPSIGGASMPVLSPEQGNLQT
jgi:hypothetical protein